MISEGLKAGDAVTVRRGGARGLAGVVVDTLPARYRSMDRLLLVRLDEAWKGKREGYIRESWCEVVAM